VPKVDRPLFSDEATGELGGVLAFKRGPVYGRIEKKRVASKSNSPGQAAARAAYQAAKNTWLGLSDGEQLTWREGAPAGWTGFNYFLSVTLLGGGFFLGALVLGADVINQGNKPATKLESGFEHNFPESADVIEEYEDGADPVKAWMINGLVESLLVIEQYLLFYKSRIEGS